MMVPDEAEREPQSEDITEMNSAIQTLRQQWNAEGLPDEEFLELYEQIFDSVRTELPRNVSPENGVSKRWLYWTILTLILFIFAVTADYQLIRCVTCSFQNYIYPVLRFVRQLFIPIICLFPSLTRMYHETCVMDNPFYKASDMDCWPCSSLSNIHDIPAHKTVDPLNALFISKTDQEVITLAKLKAFYLSNKHIFDKEASLILIDNRSYITPTEMITQQELEKKHTYIWEFNNINVGRLLRQIIPRPQIVPKYGQSVERYLIIDSSNEDFYVPNTECNFSFLLALSGSRTIELEPSEECESQCKKIKVELAQTYLLWYNWWYWRPVIQQSTGNTTFIAHVGSYC